MTHPAAHLDAVSASERITIARLHHFNQGQSLGGISISELRDQGAPLSALESSADTSETASDLVLDVTRSWAWCFV